MKNLLSNNWSRILLCLFFLSSNGFGENTYDLYLDYARFRYDSVDTYLELYYLVAPTDTIKEDSELLLEVEISTEEQEALVDRQQIECGFKRGETAFKMGIMGAKLKEGTYDTKMVLYDNEDKKNVMDSLVLSFSAGAFDQERITLSDIELSSNIIPKSPRKNSPFYKNTLEVYPNPTRIFGQNHSRLYYYIELYNINKQAKGNDIQIEVVIADSEGQIRKKKEYSRSKMYKSLVEKGAFEVSNLENGLYAVVFAVTDSVSDYSVYRRSNFYINNPHVKLAEDASENEEMRFLESRYFRMSNQELDECFEQASFIATPDEEDIYSHLKDVESKKRFLFKFWKEREKENPGIEDKYYERVEYATEQFRVSGIPGWKTDMGRVYIVYGPPDNIERNPFEGGTNPYEIWFYETIEGGSEFDFVDLSGYGNYQLVNSTVRAEVDDPDWREYIYKR